MSMKHTILNVVAVLFFMLVGTVISWSYGQHPPQPADPNTTLKMPGVVQATGFELIDLKGRRHGGLRLTAEGSPSLYLLDEHGTLRASIFLLDEENQPRIALYDAEGKQYWSDGFVLNKTTIEKR